MNKSTAMILLAAAALMPAAAEASPAPMMAAMQRTELQATARSITVERSQNFLFVEAELGIDSVARGTNRELWIAPVIGNEQQSDTLPVIVMAGRNRYYQALRHDLAGIADVTLLRDDYRTAVYTYRAQIPYEDWMNGQPLKVILELRGCCSDSINRQELMLTNVNVAPIIERFIPAFNWITPPAETVKHREIRGQAYVDFPVNQTIIYPDYRRNTVELAKIRASIDSVHRDKDITITGLSIKGYASPEGPWDNNVRLAKGRTAALKTYVENLYDFAPNFIQTDYDPEDWGGLRAYVESSNIANRQAILAIIDSDLKPDPKNAMIQSTYPEQYKFLLAEVYPGLRHSDYKIDYTIRTYTDVNEILTLVKTRPQNLSLNEFYLASQAVEPGSADYNEIFETAVRMYPDSEVANLNAANAAMSRGDYESAAKYLAKTGDTPEAIYGRGILAALQGNYAEARTLFEQAARLKVADAPAAIEQINALQGKN